MQTFLPYPDFPKCALVLDDRRLANQLNEVRQIARVLIGESDGWRNHPAVAMWRGHLGALLTYGAQCYTEWMRRFDEGRRGGKRAHKSGEWILFGAPEPALDEWARPSWLYAPAVCSAYRALLLAKDPEWYGQFNWPEQPDPDSARIFEMIKGEMENAR